MAGIGLVAALSALTFAAPVLADNWGGANVAKNIGEGILQIKYATELQGHDVDLTKAQFGPGNVSASLHLGIDLIHDANGGSLDYNAAVAAVPDKQLYVNAGSAFNPKIVTGKCD